MFKVNTKSSVTIKHVVSVSFDTKNVQYYIRKNLSICFLCVAAAWKSTAVVKMFYANFVILFVSSYSKDW